MNKEEILNQALEMLKSGKSEQEVLASFPNAQKDLAPLLLISKTLFSTPKNIVPTPVMQRKYTENVGNALWLKLTSLSRFYQVSFSMAVVFCALFATGYAANQSSPGDKLFTLKKTGEKLQLVLASNQEARASLEIKITEKRLLEAQAILSNPSTDPNQKTAVINELTAQTTAAITETSKTDTSSSQIQPKLASLENITKQQQALIKQVKTDTSIQDVTDNAIEKLNQSTEKLTEIKQIVAVADQEQSLTKLSSDPDAVAVMGQVSKISSTQITVEKTTFTLNQDTTVQNLKGKTLSLKDLNIGFKVSITGKKSNTDTVLAKTVIIIQDKTTDQKGDVEGTSTSTPSTTSTTTDTKIIPTPTPTPEKTTNSNSASGSYIIEDPSPQFIQ